MTSVSFITLGVGQSEIRSIMLIAKPSAESPIGNGLPPPLSSVLGFRNEPVAFDPLQWGTARLQVVGNGGRGF